MRRFIIASLLVSSACATASAQDDKRDAALEAMQACRQISVAEVRLACMDAASDLLDEINQAEAIPVSPPVPSINKEAEALEQERAALAAEREALARQRAELSQAREQQNAAALATKEAERLTAERAALEAEREEIERKRTELAELEKESNTAGRERRSFVSALSPFSNERPPAETSITVVKITKNKQNVHKFFTSDGDVLIQADTSRNLRPPSSLPAEAIVHRTTLGAKWIAFAERPKRRLKVKLPPLN